MRRRNRSQMSEDSGTSQDSSQRRRVPSEVMRSNRNKEPSGSNRVRNSSGRPTGSQESRQGQREASATRPSAHNVKLGAYVRAGIMKHEKMTSNQLKRLIQRCCEELNVPFTDELVADAGLTSLRKAINEETKLLNLEVKRLESEFDGSHIYYFGPIKSNEVFRFQTYWTKPETELFNKLMKMILCDSPDFWISKRNCLVEARKVKTKYSLEELDNFVNRLVKTGYFETEQSDTYEEEENESSQYTLGVRSVQEFMGEINENYPGVLATCQLCKKSLLHGYKCAAPNCFNTIHTYCWEKYQEAFPDGRTCPKSTTGCEIDWSVQGPVKRSKT